MTKFCRSCGRDLREDELFCSKCGTKVISSFKENVIKTSDEGSSDEIIGTESKEIVPNIHVDQSEKPTNQKDLIFDKNDISINLSLLLAKCGNDRASATNEFIKMTGINTSDSIKIIDNAYEGRIYKPVEKLLPKKKKKKYSKYVPYVLLFPFLPYYFIIKSKKIKTIMKVSFLIGYTAFLMFLVGIQEMTPVKTLSISPSIIGIDKDAFQEIIITYTPTNATNVSNLSCVAKNKDVISVTNKKITGLSAGETTLTCSLGDVVSNEIKITVKLTAEQTREIAKQALLVKYGSKGYSVLIEKGITDAMVESLDSVLTKVDIGKIDSANAATLTNGISSFAITTKKGSFTIGFKDSVLFSITDDKNVSIYSKNTINSNYVFAADIDLTSFRDKSIELIRAKLKAPSTAEFPGSFWDGYDGWKYLVKNNVVSIISYVDSQNSFGAMIRSNFLIQYTYTKSSDKWNVTYFEFSGNSSGKFVN